MGQTVQAETVRLAFILVERNRKRARQMRGLLRTGEEGVEEGAVRQDILVLSVPRQSCPALWMGRQEPGITQAVHCGMRKVP